MRISPVAIFLATVCAVGVTAYFLLFSDGSPSNNPYDNDSNSSSSGSHTSATGDSINSNAGNSMSGQDGAGSTTDNRLPLRKGLTPNERSLAEIFSESENKSQNPGSRALYIQRQMLLQLDPVGDEKLLGALKAMMNKMARRQLSSDVALLAEISKEAKSTELRQFATTLTKSLRRSGESAAERRALERERMRELLKDIDDLKHLIPEQR